MKFNLYGYILFFIVLSGCTNTKLHIVNQGYSDTKINQLTLALANEGVDVIISNLTIPTSFPDSALALNPNFRDLSFINAIQHTLTKQGFPTATELRFAQGKHFYSTSHLGLYLRNKLDRSSRMPPYLRTQYCKNADSTIMFKPNGEFTLEYESNNYDEQLKQVKGRYTFVGKKLTLRPHRLKAQHFTLYKETRPTPFGDKPADVFKPKNKSHKVKQLKCDFLIIYMD
jgi:hypothetical protein